MSFYTSSAQGAGEKKSPYPTVYCDENLYVADISPTAKESDFSHLLGMSLKEHLSEKDISALLSCLYYKKSGSENRANHGVFVDLVNIRGTKCAYATVVSLFGRLFFEMRLFRSRVSMFKDFEVSRLLLSDIPYVPEYDLRRNRISILDSRDKLEKVFSAGHLKNLYQSALEPFREVMLFNAVEATRRVIADLSFALELDGAKFSLYTDEKGEFSHSVIDVSNYVNLVALLMIISARVSLTGKVEAALSCTKDRVSLLFTTQAKAGKTQFVGGFAFPFLAEMYPELSAFMWAAKFIGELYGLRCYAELSGKDTLTVELLMKSAPPDMEIGVMHPEDTLLENLLETAKSLVHYMNSAQEQ